MKGLEQELLLLDQMNNAGMESAYAEPEEMEYEEEDYPPLTQLFQ